MNEIETVELLCSLLAMREPFLHVRFGDGDVFFATGTGPKLTADGEHWSPELQYQLREAWKLLAVHPGRLLVGDVETYMVSDGCEVQWLDLVQEAEELRGLPLEFVHMEALRASVGVSEPFYAAVAADPRRKVYVAPERLGGAARALGADHEHIPLHIAHEAVEEIVNNVAWMVMNRDVEIVLFSAGRGGKIMQAMLSSHFPLLTQIDVGSGLDILFTDLRRGTDRRADPEAYRQRFRASGLDL